jgi:signal peptidase I
MQAMRSTSRQFSILTTLLSLFISGIVWLALAPTQLGGSVTYVIVDGNSMEPRFHLGDLVLVRTESSYGEGDAIIYQNAQMGRYVFHRIIKTELGRFILQGDNNSWLDSYQPVQDEIIGKLWVHIPKLGKVVEWVRLPINMALAVALLGGVVMSGMVIKPSKNGKKGNKPSKNFGGMREGGLYLFAFLALAFLGLSIFSFTRPLTISSANLPYQQEGRFFYSATGTPGIYDTELVRSGEPVFPRLTCFLNLGFTYNLIGDQLQGAAGSHQLYARVLDHQSGWLRTIPLSPQTAFSGNTYFSMATLDLCQVESLVTMVEQETGLHANTYTVEIVAEVAVTGLIAGSPINDTFVPSLIFEFDKVHLYLASDDPQMDSLYSLKQGLAGSADLRTNTFTLFGLDFTVRSIRVIALLGFGLSLMGLSVVGLNLYRTARRSPDALIQLKYGGMLVDVYEQNLAPTTSTVDVTTIDNLAKLAERHGTMILHMARNFLHYYLVQANNTTYRYMISVGRKGDVETEPVENKTVEVVAAHDESGLIIFEPEPARKTSPPNMISDHETVELVENNEMKKSTDVEADLVWKQIQSDASHYLASHAENQTSDIGPIHYESQEYVIQTGTIESYMIESSDAVVLRKVKL